jgi:hypothetical protein
MTSLSVSANKSITSKIFTGNIAGTAMRLPLNLPYGRSSPASVSDKAYYKSPETYGVFQSSPVKTGLNSIEVVVVVILVFPSEDSVVAG